MRQLIPSVNVTQQRREGENSPLLLFRRKPAGHPGAGPAPVGTIGRRAADTVARIAPPTADRRDKMAPLALFGAFSEGPVADLFRQTRFRSWARNDRAIGRLRRHIDLVAAHLNRQGKKWRRMALFRRPKAPFFGRLGQGR